MYCAPCERAIDNWLKDQDDKIKTYIDAYKYPKREPTELVEEINNSLLEQEPKRGVLSDPA